MSTHGTGNLDRGAKKDVTANRRPSRRSDPKRSNESRNRTLTYRAARNLKGNR